MAIAVGDFVTALQFLVIGVLDTQRAPDVVDHVLVRCRVVATRGFVDNRRGRLPISINVTGGEGRARVGVLRQALVHLGPAGPGGRGAAVEVKARRDAV